MFDSAQICETLNTGLIVLDRDLRVRMWNRWMCINSGIEKQEILGKPIVEFYPELDDPKFSRFVKSVFSFGNYAFFSQKLHQYLLPMKNPHASAGYLPLMQQNCTAGPIRNEQGEIHSIFISIQDVTDYVAYEHRLIELSKIDYLTRLYNRSHLQKRLAEEIERARRYGTPLSIFMIDVDYFKNINDSRGHLCGDQAMRELAVLLQRVLRSMDIIGRYGGEEFCCVLPQTEASSACLLAERLREAVEENEIEYGDSTFSITISLGVAELNADVDTLEKLIKAADDALYRAKRAGRNCVVCAPGIACGASSHGRAKSKTGHSEE